MKPHKERKSSASTDRQSRYDPIGPEKFAHKAYITDNRDTIGKTPAKEKRRSAVSNTPPSKIIYANPTRGINTGKRVISHASLEKLVEKITEAQQYDADFRDAFLLCFRSFCSTLDFVRALLQRYAAARAVMTNSETQLPTSDMSTPKEANVVIVRIMSALKRWIKESGHAHQDLLGEREALEMLRSFFLEAKESLHMPTLQQHASQMLDIITQFMAISISKNASTVLEFQRNLASNSISGSSFDKHQVKTSKLQHEETSATGSQDMKMCPPALRRGSSGGSTPSKEASGGGTSAPMGLPPPPAMVRGATTGSMADRKPRVRSASGSPGNSAADHLSKSRNATDKFLKQASRTQPLSGISPQRAAEQLTLIESERYFNRIKHRELTNRAWTRENKRIDSPGVIAMIEQFDARAEWVSSEILHPKLQTVERAKMIQFFIDVADCCRRLHNYNCVFEIVTGISAPCIKQLNTTWGLVQGSHIEKLQLLNNLCSLEDNYKNYRQAFALSEGQPRLPCLFVLAKDLYGLEISSPSLEYGLVHFRKFEKIYAVIKAALDCQNTRYLHRQLPANAHSQTGNRTKTRTLEVDEHLQAILRHRLDTVRKNSVELFRLAKKANTQESILFVNSLSEAGFL